MKKRGSINRYGKGQIATEHLILTGIILFLVIPVLFIISKDQTKTPYMTDAVNTIDKAVESLSNLGSGSSDTVVINVPGDIAGAIFKECANANADVKCKAIEVTYGDGSIDVFEMKYFVGGSVAFFDQKGIHYVTLFNDGGNQQIVFQECGDGYVTGGEQCEPCASDLDCNAQGQICDVDTGSCTIGGFIPCSKGCFESTSEFGCFCQCQLDIDCPYGICLEGGVCGGCENDNECNPGSFCSGGVCQSCDQDGDGDEFPYSAVCVGPFDCNDLEANENVTTSLLEGTQPLTCDDGYDNDCVPPKDCAIIACAGVGICSSCITTESGTEITCNDGEDNDCDGFADCQDADCHLKTGPGSVMCCVGDGLTDGLCSGSLDSCNLFGTSYLNDTCVGCNVQDGNLCDAFSSGCTASALCDEFAPGYTNVNGEVCESCSSTCGFNTDSDIVASVACTSCSSGAQQNADTCYYNIACSSSGWTEVNEICETSCVGDAYSGGGACPNIHNPAVQETCYWTRTCTDPAGCGYTNSAFLNQYECDTCSSGGVTNGNECQDLGTLANDVCWFGGTYTCSGINCNVGTEACTPYCIVNDVTGLCEYVNRTVPLGDNDCNYNAVCNSATGCSYDIGTLLDYQCDACDSDGVEPGPVCPGDGLVSGNGCYYGNWQCSYGGALGSIQGFCDLNAQFHGYPSCQDGAITDGSMHCMLDSGDVDKCLNQPGDACVGAAGPIPGWDIDEYDCDIYDIDHNQGGDSTFMQESEVSATKCTTTCSGSGCCELDATSQAVCNAGKQCNGFHDFLPQNQIFSNPDNANATCYRTNAGGWDWALNAEPSENNCFDGYDNDCDGYVDGEDDNCVITLQSNPVSPQVGAPITFSLVESYSVGTVNVCDSGICNVADGTCTGVEICDFTFPGSTSCVGDAPLSPGNYGYNACLGKNADNLLVTILADAHCSADPSHSVGDSVTPQVYKHEWMDPVWDIYACTDLNGITCACTGVGTGTLSRDCDIYECQESTGAGCFIGPLDYNDNTWLCNDAIADTGGTCGSQFCDTTGSGNEQYRCYKNQATNNAEWIKQTSLPATETACSDGYDNDCDGFKDGLDLPDCLVCYDQADFDNGVTGIIEHSPIPNYVGGTGRAAWILEDISICPGETILLQDGATKVASIVLAGKNNGDAITFDCNGQTIIGDASIHDLTSNTGVNLFEVSSTAWGGGPALDNRVISLQNCNISNKKITGGANVANTFQVLPNLVQNTQINILDNNFTGCGTWAGNAFSTSSKPCFRSSQGPSTNTNTYVINDNDFTGSGLGEYYFLAFRLNTLTVGTNSCNNPAAITGYCNLATGSCPPECVSGNCPLSVCS
jgi:hypothetical protein